MADLRNEPSAPEPPPEDIAQLRARLEEAEQTLEAIRTGQIDALVASGPQGDQVYTLTGADHIYRTIVETMNEAALTVDFDGMILFCNQQFARMMRLAMEEIRGQRMTRFVADPQRSVLDSLLRRAQSAPVRGRLVLKADDDTVVHVQLAASPLQIEAGNSICLVVNDLTELEASARSVAVLRKQQQELEQSQHALQESEASFRSVLDNSRDVIYRLNVQTGLYEYISPSALDVTGFTSDELRAQSIQAAHAMVHPDDVTAVRAAMDRLEETGRGEVEYRQLAKNGDYRWISNRMSLTRDGAGRPLYRDGNIRDITDRKRAEEAVRQTANDLARSNRDLEQFAYVASHDLQEPLRMVTNFMKLLHDQYAGQLDAKAQEYIGYSVDGANRMSMLIEDLLEYSRVGAKGKKSAPVDLAAVVNDVKANLRATIEESNALVTTDALPTVMGDEGQMHQLFQNLIGNALKFRVAGRRPEVHIGARQETGQWVFQVKDNGIGIDAEQRDRVFVIFQRLHTREEYPGTGIGLAICQKIVERHGGRIWVESKLGEGSVFFFTIPDRG